MRILSSLLAALLLLTVSAPASAACGGLDCASGTKAVFGPPPGCGMSRAGSGVPEAGPTCCCGDESGTACCAERGAPPTTLRGQQGDPRPRPAAPTTAFFETRPTCAVSSLSAVPATFHSASRFRGTPGYLLHQSLLL